MKKIILIIWHLLFLIVAADETYNYPLKNRFESTVIGTPHQYLPIFPKDIPVKHYSISVFPERDTPDIFWYNSRFKFSLAKQKKKAPLVLVIGGAGTGYNSIKLKRFQKIFYSAGYHVVLISSPTYPNFIVSASSSHIPGILQEDSEDVYRVIKKAYDKIKGKIEVSEFYLAGYSLGATQAAYISKLDDEKNEIGFSKILMINPAVCLYNSATIFDSYVDNMPNGVSDIDHVVENILDKIAKYYQVVGAGGEIGDGMDFVGDFFYEFFKKEKLPDEELAALIGIAYRLSSVDLAFASDISSNSKVYVGDGFDIARYESLNKYFKKLIKYGFIDYFENIVSPYYMTKYGGDNIENIKRATGIRQIKDYLEKSKKIGVFTNEDELILSQEDLNFLKSTFKGRIKVYPYGGHCGNMFYKENVEDYIIFLNGGGVEL